MSVPVRERLIAVLVPMIILVALMLYSWSAQSTAPRTVTIIPEPDGIESLEVNGRMIATDAPTTLHLHRSPIKVSVAINGANTEAATDIDGNIIVEVSSGDEPIRFRPGTL